MRYDRWSYIWPPRPRTAIPFTETARYARGGWIAQPKLNGTRNLVAVSPDGVVSFRNRHKEQHRAWTPPPSIVQAVRDRFACGRWMVLDSELLHNRHASVKNTIYLFGALVLDGEYLVGEIYGSAYESLADRCGQPSDVKGYSGFVADMGGWPGWSSRSIGGRRGPSRSPSARGWCSSVRRPGWRSGGRTGRGPKTRLQGAQRPETNS